MQRVKRENRWAEDRGAAAMLVGVLLASGALITSVALVVDSGRLYLEHRVLQNGADTLAVSLAQACAAYDTNPALAAAADCQDPPSNIVSATSFGDSGRIPFDSNTTEAYKTCGLSSMLPACTGPSIGTNDCKTAIDANSGNAFNKYARVYTRTTQRGTTGGTALYPLFTSLLAVNPNGTELKACSQAAWVYRSIAPVPNATYMPFAISACDYSETRKVIVGYYASSTNCTSITDHGGVTTTCSGGCQPGLVGFDYVAKTGCAPLASQNPKISIYGTTNSIGAPSSEVCVKATVGSSPSPGLNNLKATIGGTFSNSYTPESIYTVPIFDKLTKPASYNQIRIVGFGYFRLLGYKFPGSTFVATGETPTWNSTCGTSFTVGNNYCIYGYFEPHVYVNSTPTDLTEISRPTFWDGTYAIKRIP